VRAVRRVSPAYRMKPAEPGRADPGRCDDDLRLRRDRGRVKRVRTPGTSVVSRTGRVRRGSVLVLRWCCRIRVLWWITFVLVRGVIWRRWVIHCADLSHTTCIMALVMMRLTQIIIIIQITVGPTMYRLIHNPTHATKHCRTISTRQISPRSLHRHSLGDR